jgi:ABC transport system ATP-binding/permease protein
MPPRSTQILATWLIGTDPSCDLVVQHPMASSQHCRLTRYVDRFTLEDLGSTNGTFIDEARIPPRRPTLVTRHQRVTLGGVAALPWPDEAKVRSDEPGVIRIGRSPDSDVVLDYPIISWEHARIVDVKGQLVLEDLNSSNGTAINEVQNRITRAPITPKDDVYLGSFKIPAARLLTDRQVVLGEAAFESVVFARDSLVIGRDPQCDHPVNHPMLSWHHAKLSRTPEGLLVEDLGSLNGTFVDGARITRPVRVVPGQEIGLGSVRFQLLENGALQQREYLGNVSIRAVDVTVNTPN